MIPPEALRRRIFGIAAAQGTRARSARHSKCRAAVQREDPFGITSLSRQGCNPADANGNLTVLSSHRIGRRFTAARISAGHSAVSMQACRRFQSPDGIAKNFLCDGNGFCRGRQVRGPKCCHRLALRNSDGSYPPLYRPTVNGVFRPRLRATAPRDGHKDRCR